MLSQPSFPAPMPVRAMQALSALALSFAIAACGSTPIGTDVPAPSTSVRDSAGIRIVAAGFSRDSLTASELLTVLDTLLDGRRPDDEAVVGLVALQPIGDSSIVMFSESGPTLIRYSTRAGDAPDTIGHHGTEPGAYGPRATLLPFVRDTLLLWDRDAGRISRVTADSVLGDVLLDYPMMRLAAVSGAFRDGTPIGVTVALPAEQGAGVSRAPMSLLRFTPNGAFRDTLAHVRGPERSVQIGRPGAVGDNTPVRSGSVPFGRTTLWTVGTNSVLLHDTEGCHVARHDSTGALIMRLDFGCSIEAVTDEDRAQFLAEILSTSRSRSDSAIRRRFVDEASFPPAKSTASGLLTDPWDRIWIRLPVDNATADWVWWVFDAEGIPMVRFGLGRQWRIAAVRERDVIAVQSDRTDVPPVVVRMALPAALHRAR